MNFLLTTSTALLILVVGGGQARSLLATEVREPGYWSSTEADEILEKTLAIRLAPDLSGLNDEEHKAVSLLLEAGQILHDLYLDSRHHQASVARSDLLALRQRADDSNSDAKKEYVQKLLDLFWMFRGPIATTLDNRRVPFLPVDPELPGKNLYPLDLERQELAAFLETHGRERSSILEGRTVVRRGTSPTLEADLDTLAEYPVLSLLHPGLQARLEAISPSNPPRLYAVPYSLEYAEELLEVYDLLQGAAESIAGTDEDFAAYLRHRARDLLIDDYEAGDAAWVTGSFKKLNAQIGSYETYGDQLNGVKTFFSTSILVQDEDRTRDLARAIDGLQAIEDSLPYSRRKKVRENIPVGVYNVIADFGQARGTNTASILPNESSHAKKYGRTILLRYNIMTNPDLFADTKKLWTAAVVPQHVADLTMEGSFNRTLWHEIGHYLGADQDAQGRDLGIALGEHADLLEELKADLVSLYAGPALEAAGYYDADSLRALYADGVRRVLQRVKPRPTQPYQSMQLMQMNFFLENKLLSYDSKTQRLTIDYEIYPQVVERMLKEVLAIQASGSKDGAKSLVDHYSLWREELHGVLAQGLRNAGAYRYRLVRYGALGQ
jgi:hypothetical protein